MEILIITGSPGAGKTSVSNALAEQFRKANTPHLVIDPDEIARIYPEKSLNEVKLEALATLYPFYVKHGVDRMIIPLTIDSDTELNQLHELFGQENVRVITLVTDEAVLLKRVAEREPDEYWKNKLSKLVRVYIRNDYARTFNSIKINVGNLSVTEVSNLLVKKLSL